MKKGKIIGLLLLAAFLCTLGFNEPAFADNKFRELSKKLDEIKAQIQTHDGDIAAEQNDLLTKLNEIQALINTNHDILEDIDAATSEACPDSWSKILLTSTSDEQFELAMNGEDLKYSFLSPFIRKRFELVMNGEAVLDKETCLVWERSPSTTPMNWFNAQFHCYDKVVGGRKGWRLPTVEELASLIDPTQFTPALPAGHPFQNVPSDWCWSATTIAGNTSHAWGVIIGNGFVDDVVKSSLQYVWCVRGGHGYDGQ